MADELFGNTAGLGADESRALLALYRRKMGRSEFVTAAVARELTEVSLRTRRRIGILVNRQGEVEYVVVGEAHRVFLPDLGPRRGGTARFRGVRLILTNLRPEGLAEDDLTDLVLLQLDAVATIEVRPDGLPGKVQLAHLLPPDTAEKPWALVQIPSVHDWDEDFAKFIHDLEGQFTRSPHLKRIEAREPVILVGIALGGKTREAKRSMDELARLAETAGLEVVDQTVQARKEIDGRTCIGQGKLQELVVRSMHKGAVALIFDRELSPSQLRNIATATELKVLDRTQLILDIFAQHALSREGKLQVELAQLRYRMPRLSLMPTAMSRLTGGIGGRGPGETKLEINKRRAQERLNRLERELEDLGQDRALRRRRRQRTNIPTVAIVGYTNAGKSTLLNRLTHSDVLVEDKLFATLDPTSRRFRFPEEREILISDTVGFIQDLPQTLVAAFKATLEELEEATLLLHVHDASDPEVDRQREAVEEILAGLDLVGRPRLNVWNKADAADPQGLKDHIARYGGVPVCALNGEGALTLLDEIERILFRSRAQAAAQADLDRTAP